MILHHFTIDVEEYFHPTVMAPHYPMAHWDDHARRSPAVVTKILDFLLERRALGTFFVLGWLAEREPDMVRSIARAGHEVASHGWEHDLIGRLGPERFRDSVRRSKGVLEDLIGSPVLGYRAPSFSIVPGFEWAFDVLLEEGYRYDASLFPVARHPTYGYPCPNEPHWIERAGGRLLEFPATTARVLNMTLPASGGAYFRLLPPWLVRTGLRQAADCEQPGMFYIHPWELDDWRPEVDARRRDMVRTFAGRKRTWGRLNDLFGRFSFGPIRSTFEAMTAETGQGGP